MKQNRHTVDQIIAKLRRADVELGKGKKVPEVCRNLEVTDQTYYRWRQKYGGMQPEMAKNGYDERFAAATDSDVWVEVLANSGSEVHMTIAVVLESLFEARSLGTTPSFWRRPQTGQQGASSFVCSFLPRQPGRHQRHQQERSN